MQQLLTIIIALLAVSWLIDRYAGLHRNISLLFLAVPLMTAAAPMMVFIGGIISSSLAPDPAWVTLPLTMMIAGTAVATVPAAMLARRLGRRKATMLGFSSGLIGGLLGIVAVKNSWFSGFVLAAFIMGFSGAFAQQLRFAAIESLADPADIPKAISLLMLTGIFAAMIGPELAFVSKDWLSSPHGYAGTFLGIGLMALLAIAVVSRFQAPPMSTPGHRPARPALVGDHASTGVHCGHCRRGPGVRADEFCHDRHPVKHASTACPLTGTHQMGDSITRGCHVPALFADHLAG